MVEVRTRCASLGDQATPHSECALAPLAETPLTTHPSLLLSAGTSAQRACRGQQRWPRDHRVGSEFRRPQAEWAGAQLCLRGDHCAPAHSTYHAPPVSRCASWIQGDHGAPIEPTDGASRPLAAPFPWKPPGPSPV
jgi:hypothetical protein